MTEEQKGFWERTAMPLTQHGLSYRNMRRINRARRNGGRVTALRFDWTKGFKG